MEKILTVKNLSVRFKNDKTQALDDVSFDLFSNDVLAIDGMNGSGKTTLIKLITGQTNDFIIDSGEIIYHPFSEKSIFDFSEKEMLQYLSSIGYVPQKDPYEGLNHLTVSDLIDNVIDGTSFTKEDATLLFDKYFGGSSRIKMKSRPARLSGGEQRMISIFLGLVCRKSAKLMIVDEPLNNLDFENVMKVSDLLNSLHKDSESAGMILVTHCKIITCVNRQRKMVKGHMEDFDTKYECHHCMGEPDCDLYYLKNMGDADHDTSNAKKGGHDVIRF